MFFFSYCSYFILSIQHFINPALLFHVYLCGIMESCLQSVCINVITRNRSTSREAGEKDGVSSGAQWVMVLLAKGWALDLCRYVGEAA